MVSLPLEPHRLPPGSHQSFKALAFQNLDSGVVLWLRFNPAEVLSVFPTKDEEGPASAAPGSAREKAETAAAEQEQDTDAPDIRDDESGREIARRAAATQQATPRKSDRSPSTQEQAFVVFLEERHGGVMPSGVSRGAVAAEYSEWIVSNPFARRSDEWRT